MQAAKNAITAAVEVESELRMEQEARIVELEALLEAARLQVRPPPLYTRVLSCCLPLRLPLLYGHWR